MPCILYLEFLIQMVIIFLITAGVEELNSTFILGLLQVCFRHVCNVFIIEDINIIVAVKLLCSNNIN